MATSSRFLASFLVVSYAVISCAAASLQAQGSVGPVVQTTSGPIQGGANAFSYYFKGVPFAAPPVGSLRFQDPQPPTPWTNVLNTTTFSAGCMQSCVLPKPSVNCPAVMSEDCLYLNVYTPTLTPRALPVMIFIHGGAFVAGAAGTPLYESTQFAKDQQMVVVAGNYRLGAFGAYFGEGAPGNYQLKDQRMVFQWVVDNIAQFGGDPSRIVIAGESAGAMSVGCHLASPKSWPYFNSSIMSSNPFGLLMLNTTQAASLGSIFAEGAGCKGGALSCLQSVDANTLLNASVNSHLFPWPDQVLTVPVPWVPIVTGDAELPVQPLFATGDQVNPNSNVVIGCNANDSLLFIYEATGAATITSFEADLLLSYVFGITDAIRIKEFYGHIPSGQPVQQYLAEMLNDYLFLCPRRFYARNTAAKGTIVYQYLFDHVPSMSSWIWNASSTPVCDDFVCHADDLPFVFNSVQFIANAPQFTADERQLVQLLQSAYGNAVHTRGAQVTAGWSPAYNTATKTGDSAWRFSGTGGQLMSDHRSAQCDFWDSIGYDRN